MTGAVISQMLERRVPNDPDKALRGGHLYVTHVVIPKVGSMGCDVTLLGLLGLLMSAPRCSDVRVDSPYYLIRVIRCGVMLNMLCAPFPSKPAPPTPARWSICGEGREECVSITRVEIGAQMQNASLCWIFFELDFNV